MYLNHIQYLTIYINECGYIVEMVSKEKRPKQLNRIDYYSKRRWVNSRNKSNLWVIQVNYLYDYYVNVILILSEVRVLSKRLKSIINTLVVLFKIFLCTRRCK